MDGTPNAKGTGTQPPMPEPPVSGNFVVGEAIDPLTKSSPRLIKITERSKTDPLHINQEFSIHPVFVSSAQVVAYPSPDYENNVGVSPSHGY